MVIGNHKLEGKMIKLDVPIYAFSQKKEKANENVIECNIEFKIEFKIVFSKSPICIVEKL